MPISGGGSGSGLTAIADKNTLANTSGSSAVPVATTLTTLLDSVFGTTRGSTLTRGASAWSLLAPGTTGQALLSAGNGADLYFGDAASVLQVKPTATVATTAALPTNTYLSGVITGTVTGTLTVDGHVVALNDIVLVKNETTSANNGLYSCTTAGAVGVAFVLTRHVDMNTASEFSGSMIPVGNTGTTNANSLWLANPTTPVTVGTTSIPFTQLNGATDIIAGTGISISGNTVSLSDTVVPSTSSFSTTDRYLTRTDLRDFNFTLQGAAASAWGGIRGTQAYTTGKHYCEFKIRSLAGDANGLILGLADSTTSTNTSITFPGNFAKGYGVSSANASYVNGTGTFDHAAGVIATNDVIGIAFDGDAHTMKVYLNNTLAATCSTLEANAFKPCVGLYHYANSVTLVTDSALMTYTPPSGYSAWG